MSAFNLYFLAVFVVMLIIKKVRRLAIPRTFEKTTIAIINAISAIVALIRGDVITAILYGIMTLLNFLRREEW